MDLKKMDLKKMSVAKLEQLRDKIDLVIFLKLTKEVPLTDFHFSPPDDRSYGNIQFIAKTRHGDLHYSASIGSDGEVEDAKVLLYSEGRNINDGPDEPDFDGFANKLDLDTSDKQAQSIVVKAVLDWAEGYNT